MGTAEKTELDGHFESLAERAECTKTWTEKILRNTEAVLTPNPGNRAEDYLFEKIEKKKPVRLSNIEYLGLDMIEVRNTLNYIHTYNILNLSLVFVLIAFNGVICFFFFIGFCNCRLVVNMVRVVRTVVH